MEYHDALKIAGVSTAEIERGKQHELKACHRDLKDAKESVGKKIQSLQKFYLEKVHPFVVEVKAAGIKDAEVEGCLFELERLANKPAELQIHLKEADSISWKQISQTTYPDQVDTFKRDALIRHFRNRLTKFGNVEGTAVDLMNRIRERVLLLAEQPGLQTIEAT